MNDLESQSDTSNNSTTATTRSRVVQMSQTSDSRVIRHHQFNDIILFDHPALKEAWFLDLELSVRLCAAGVLRSQKTRPGYGGTGNKTTILNKIAPNVWVLSIDQVELNLAIVEVCGTWVILDYWDYSYHQQHGEILADNLINIEYRYKALYDN